MACLMPSASSWLHFRRMVAAALIGVFVWGSWIAVPGASQTERARFIVSALGVGCSVWGCWDGVLDLLVMFSVELRGWVPRLMPARWREIMQPVDRQRARALRSSAALSLQRGSSRLWMLMVQLILSVSAMLDDAPPGADWKLILQMSGVVALALNALSDRLERRMLANQLLRRNYPGSC